MTIVTTLWLRDGSGQTGIKQTSDFLVCSSSKNSPATKPNWSLKLLGNSKQTSNTPTTFKWKIMSKFCVFLPGGPGGSSHKKCHEHSDFSSLRADVSYFLPPAEKVPFPRVEGNRRRLHAGYDFSSMHKLTTSAATRLNWSFESLDNLNKLRMLPERLNEKSRPNSVRSHFVVCTSAEYSSTTKPKYLFLNRLAILNKYRILSKR